MNDYLFLIIGELIVLLIIILAKLFLNYKEKHKVDNILNFIKKKSDTDKDINKSIKDCINIIKNNKEENKDG